MDARQSRIFSGNLNSLEDIPTEPSHQIKLYVSSTTTGKQDSHSIAKGLFSLLLFLISMVYSASDLRPSVGQLVRFVKLFFYGFSEKSCSHTWLNLRRAFPCMGKCTKHRDQASHRRIDPPAWARHLTIQG